MIAAFAYLIYRRRSLIVTVGFLLLALGAAYGLGVFPLLKDGGLDDPASESYREGMAFGRDFPASRVALIVILRSPTKTVDSPAYKRGVGEVLETLHQDPGVASAVSFYETNANDLVSRDRHATFLTIGLNGDGDTQNATFHRIEGEMPGDAGLSFQYGGSVVADEEVNRQVEADLPRAETVSFPLLLILLVLIFRSVVAALLPLGIGAVSILCAFALTRVLAGHMDISVFATNIISLLGLGLAIDYSLLLVSRFRDELAAEGDADEADAVPRALARTLATAGESIFFSGSTVALSLAGMLFFPQSFLRSMGLGGALATATAVVTSLTLLPAILAGLGHGINSGAIRLPGRKRRLSEPGAIRGTPAGERPGFWFRQSHWVMRHAGLVLIVTLGALLAAGVPFLHTRFADSGPDSLPAEFQSRISADILKRDFGTDQSPPIQIVVTLPGDPTSTDSLRGLSDYVGRLRSLPGVTGVDSLVTVDTKIAASGYAAYYAKPGNAAKFARARFVQGNETTISVKYTGDKDAPTVQAVVRAIRAMPLPAGFGPALVGGDTAELVDQLSSLRAHLPGAATVIVGATFALLCLMLRSLIVPIKAVLLNVLSLAATFGLMTLVFQDGHLQGPLHFTSSGSLDANLPVLIFCLAFGLSTDYEVFLVSRIKEEYLRTGDNTEAVATGVEKTGRIITSAALLLIVVVAAFAGSEMLPMKEIGVGLSIAIAIDAAVVRTLLVPATMRLFGDFNWWPFGGIPPR